MLEKFEELKIIERAIEKHDNTQVMMHTKECEIWQLSHDRHCSGCPHGLGCAKKSEMLMVMLQGAVYESKDFEDMLKTLKITQDRMTKILDAKTIDEVHQV